MIRLADLLAGLSRLADLGFGLQPGVALHASALAVGLAQTLDLDDEDVRAALYAALLVHLGCVGHAHETARMYGDELAMSAAVASVDVTDPRHIATTFSPAVLRGRPFLEQVRLAVAILTTGKRHGLAFSTASCEVGRDAARRLGLPDTVQASVYHSHEWWAGGGPPSGIAGDAIPTGARVAAVANLAATVEASAGADAAVAAVRQQAGSALDPRLVDRFAVHAPDLFGAVAAQDPRALVLDGEPRPVATVLDPKLIDVAAVFGEVADLKTPWTHGHARGVAALARAAGNELGLPARDLQDVEVAGHLHDVGRVAVPTAVWEKPSALNGHEWERVRLHAYHAERILAGSERLAPLGQLVGMHHERLDGSGYHRGSSHTDLPMAARVLAAADVRQAMSEPRPHRPALPSDRAEFELLEDVRAGRLDPEAVGAVLVAAGHATEVPASAPPAGLTAREVEVLGLVAEGSSNPRIAAQLGISRRTAEQHVQNVYRKIGVSSRAAAALFAMEHGLLDRHRRTP